MPARAVARRLASLRRAAAVRRCSCSSRCCRSARAPAARRAVPVARARRANEHTLIFDEAYYVNAARVIAGIHPPPGAHYAAAPLGDDPNAEHPQGVKLIIAGGDRAVRRRAVRLAARQPDLRLARDPRHVRARAQPPAAGRWSALGAATLMATDNLLLVHGRIGTLDIYAVAMMIWGVALYLRDRPLLAGVVLGDRRRLKEVGAVRAARRWRCSSWPRAVRARRDRGAAGAVALRGRRWSRWPPARSRASACSSGCSAIMGAIATAVRRRRGQADHRRPVRPPRAHDQLRREADQPARPAGDRLLPVAVAARSQADHLPAASTRRARPRAYAIHPVSISWAMISPPIMAARDAGARCFCAVYRALVRAAAGRAGRTLAPPDLGERGRCSALAWFLGTWVPFELLSLVDSARATSTTW